jgi:hypothetical protein
MSRKFKYGSLYHKHECNGVFYTTKHLKKWTDRELLMKHYYLTMALDGYGHETATEATKANCLTFRAVLIERGHDPIKNVMLNEMWYDWGYRDYWAGYNRPWVNPFG